MIIGWIRSIAQLVDRSNHEAAGTTSDKMEEHTIHACLRVLLYGWTGQSARWQTGSNQ